jgi:NDP-sugar pyrophosphorylase family protein
MKIIIPIAGHSRRFKEAGYKTPKPFIMIDGKPMIKRVCEMFKPTDDFIFVCKKDDAENKEYSDILNNITQNYEIAAIEQHEYGPVYSALQAGKYINNADEPVILAYGDFIQRWNYNQFLSKAAMYDGAVAVFKGFHPASFGNTYYAYTRADEKLEMIELREKRSFTDNRMNEYASTGVYYLDSWKAFLKYANEILKNKPDGVNEYYCSLLFNPMVRDGLKVCLFEVEKFICWGTPEDLEEYLFWSGYFEENANQIRSRSFKND